MGDGGGWACSPLFYSIHQKGSRMNAVPALFVYLLSVSRIANGFIATNKPMAFCRRSPAHWVASEERTELIGAEYKNLFDGYETLDFLLVEHKPLGCTVEESLADLDALPIFIAKVAEGGLADKAGLKVGDVIVGISGIFGDLSSAVGVGIDEVKKLVASRPQVEPLELRVARGTSVMAKHETALVDLCALPGGNDKEIEQCMTAFLNDSFPTDDDGAMSGCDDGTECLLDGLFDMWNEEMPAIPVQSPEPAEQVEEAKKPAPWSSRSSPSGTWVRDPKTGEMRNIDA